MYAHRTMLARSIMTDRQRTVRTAPADRRTTVLGWAGAATAVLTATLLLASLPGLAAAPSSGREPAPLPAPAPTVPAD